MHLTENEMSAFEKIARSSAGGTVLKGGVKAIGKGLKATYISRAGYATFPATFRAFEEATSPVFKRGYGATGVLKGVSKNPEAL